MARKPTGLGVRDGSGLGIRARRYHALLTAATHPPDGTYRARGRRGSVARGGRAAASLYSLSSHATRRTSCIPTDIGGSSASRVSPWPTWTYGSTSTARSRTKLVCEPASGDVVLTWQLDGGGTGVSLCGKASTRGARLPLASARERRVPLRCDRGRPAATSPGSPTTRAPQRPRSPTGVYHP